jgi:hypothetical protein
MNSEQDEKKRRWGIQFPSMSFHNEGNRRDKDKGIKCTMELQV